jgi:hypothetical protein
MRHNQLGTIDIRERPAFSCRQNQEQGVRLGDEEMATKKDGRKHCGAKVEFATNLCASK